MTGMMFKWSEQGADGKEARAERSASLVRALTSRQRDVLAGIIEGLPTKEIAFRLGIDGSTVKMHRNRLLLRLNASNSAMAVRIGVEASFAPAALIVHQSRIAASARN